jgi:hypothetical protein
MERLYFLSKVERGLEQEESGQVVGHEWDNFWDRVPHAILLFLLPSQVSPYHRSSLALPARSRSAGKRQ